VHELSLREIKKEWHGSWRAYAIGFLASILLTCVSFLLVAAKVFSEETLIYTIIGLAIVQAIVQLIFFLHVGQEAKPRWETVVFYFMVMVLFIVVLGTLWIMFDLDERLMPEMKMEKAHD
jgi:cytochrome o ubiquinol oxidase subunit IV